MEKEKLSRFISLVLRHKPETIGITLDNNGWAQTEELLKGISKTRYIDMTILEDIVATDNKQRYSFNEDKTKIRANQGHSVSVNIDFEEVKPDFVLYHGTAEKYIDSILSTGLQPRTRQYVHLSKDIETATKVGARHGKPVILEINTKEMIKDNIKIFKSKNGVYLTSSVSIKYIKRI